MTSLFVAYTHAYLYLIREREFVLRNLDVFKIGMTKQPMGLKIGRFDGYKKGSELILTVECPIFLIDDIEKQLKKMFVEKFEKHADGTEYFVGDCRRMSRLIFQAVDDAWTNEQISKKIDMLKSVFRVNSSHSSGPTFEVTENSLGSPAFTDIHEEELSNESEPKMDVVTQENREDEIRQQDLAEAQRQESEMRNSEQLESWLRDRIDFDTTATIRQSEWYADYRSWCQLTTSIPKSEKDAILTFKMLYSSKGISIGPTTYGIKLKKDCNVEFKYPHPQSFQIDEWENLLKEFRSQFIEHRKGRCKWVDLRERFVVWFKKNHKNKIVPADAVVKSSFEHLFQGICKVQKLDGKTFWGWKSHTLDTSSQLVNEQ